MVSGRADMPAGIRADKRQVYRQIKGRYVLDLPFICLLFAFYLPLICL